ncbi:MAG: SRPBCC domain-containing protein [candidate division WOR-3 bacterium]|jgi:uncharacterized protein YndB with AHSA1/START domain
MTKVLHVSVVVNCDIPRAFKMLTDNKLLESWLTEIADVEPTPGGKYELFWDRDDRESNSTIGCRITAIEENRFLAFDWKGPTQFKHFMNTIVPLTHIVVFFLPRMEGDKQRTEIHLVHSGWGDSAEWQEAREWFEKAWKAALDRLEKSISAS